MKEIGKTLDGVAVVDRYQSHLHENARTFLREALRCIDTQGRDFILEEIDFGRIIGTSDCVTTDEEDEIVFAQRLNRQGLTRFVLCREPEATSKITVILKATAEPEKYILITAFLGGRPEPEPWDRNATEESIEFWSRRALIWRSEGFVEGTQTNVCPW